MFGTNLSFTIKENGCWECSTPVNSAGYPTAKINGKTTTVHRHIYEMVFGKIPDGLVVRHKCDNKRCINPAHLETGTYGDNVRDRDERGRTATGEKNGNSKLTEAEVRLIKQSLLYFSISHLSETFSVDRKTIRDIRDGKTWANK